jgi:hypothetical protein
MLVCALTSVLLLRQLPKELTVDAITFGQRC